MTFNQQEPSNSNIILGIIIALVSYVIVGILSELLAQGNLSADKILLISRLVLWLCFAALCIYSLKVERRSIIIWKEEPYSIGGYLLSIISILGALFFGLILITLLVKLIGLPINNNSKRMDTLVLIFKRNKFLLVFSALTAGITEELIFRAYIMPRLQAFFKNAYLSIFISALFFGLMHIRYGTLMQVLGPFYIGLVFGIYYYKFSNIKVLIVCHFLWDLIALLVKTR